MPSPTSTPGAGRRILYVDAAAGNDAVSYANNSAATPWATIGRAAWGSSNRATPNATQAAQPGDVVRISAGTYVTQGTNNRFNVAYNPVNTGRADAPIRFEGVGEVNLTYSSGAGPMIGANARNYIEWSGFTIRESTAPSIPDTGQVVFFGAQGGSIESSTLVGNINWPYRVGDNYSGVRVHAARGQRVFNNLISSYGGDTGDENQAGITIYWVGDLTVENNRIERCGSGFYMKGNNTSDPVVGRFDVRRNVIRDNSYGIVVLLIPSTEAEPNRIYQNIFINNQTGIRVANHGEFSSDARNAKIVNNTFVGNRVGLQSFGNHVPDAGHMFWNNVVHAGEYAVNIYLPSSTDFATAVSRDRIRFEHNVYSTPRVSSFLLNENTTLSLGSWRQAYGHDGEAPSSVAADALFVNAAAGDYRLQAASPARSIAVDVFDLDGDGQTTDLVDSGAYATGTETIGVLGN